jgi:hypothetical protein
MVKTTRDHGIFHLSPKLQELKAFSPLTFAFERLFLVLQQASPATWFFGARRRAHRTAYSRAEWLALTKKRGRHIEIYVVFWFVTLAGATLMANSIVDYLRLAASVIAGFRAFDVVQMAINVTLFDHFRIRGPHSVSGVTRILLLGLWNYIELIVCFGIVYSAHPYWLCGATPGFDPYYFSAITQFTIGYGDISPIGVGKTIVCIQALTGSLFLVIVLARFVSLMPQVQSVQRSDRN